MGQITSGVGLISGINTADLIDQLMAIEARPKTLAQQRNAVLTTQQIAFQDINAKLLSLKLTAGGFLTNKIFKSTTATSSNESVLTATSSTSSVPGSYNFTVSRLVTSQQLITKGFGDRDSTPLAPAGGTLSFEFGQAQLNADTALKQLNGAAGATRGKIRITDRSGASATIDLSKALTVNDVLEAINNADGINVTASVDGDHFTLVDNTGATTTALAVSDISASGTSASLGLNVAAVGDTLTGSDVNNVSADTLLSSLNDGNGVRILSAQNDFRITQRDGATFDVDLSNAVDLGDVIDAINTASGGNVTASVNTAGTGLQLVDATAGATTFAVTALNSSNAAADLGILASDGDADGTIVGQRVIAALNSKLVRNLNGGGGATLGTISINDRAGTNTNVDLSSAQSVQDIVDLINNSGSLVTASLNTVGTGILLTDTTGLTTSNLTVADVSGTAAVDLNLAADVAANTIDSGNLQFRYISESTRLADIRGGLGVASGKFTITDSSGVSAEVDLTQGDEITINDVLAEINSRGLAINARVNDTGDGILIEDTGTGAVALKVEEAGSTTARDLGLLGEADNPGDDLNGTFESTVAIEATDTLDDVVDKINNAGLAITATVINDGSASNPYRLALSAKNAGLGGAFVFDDGGLGLNASTLSQAKNAVVFYGSSDPAKAIAITSATNTLTSVIPGSTVSLLAASDTPVQVSIARDDTAITDAVKTFTSDFNAVIDTLNKYDVYNTETEQRGLLLGDPTIARVRNSLFRLVNSRNTDLTSQYNALSQIGITVGTGAKLQFDEAKFATALSNDRDAVEALFTFKETETDPDTNEVTITSAGIGVRIDELLGALTDSTTGAIQARLDSLDDQIKLNNDRIEQLDKQLADKRARLEAQFAAMEKALAQLQAQGNALASFQPISTNTSSSSSG